MQTLRMLACLALASLLSVSALAQSGAKAPAAGKPAEPRQVSYDGKAAAPTGVPKPPQKASGSVRLAAFNVENLFDGVDDPKLSGDDDDLPMQTDETRLKNLAAIIRQLDADVLALEEVESEACLKWFRDTHLKDMGYEHLASREVGYYRGVEQSVLSRFPIERVETFVDLRLADSASRIPADPAAQKKGGWAKPDKLEKPGFQRSPLQADIRLPDGSLLHLFVVHFKAGGKKYAHQRELESLAVVGLVDAIRAKDADAQIAVVGDFNASPNDKTARLMREKELGGLVSAYEARPEADRRGKGEQAEGGKTGTKYLTHSFVGDEGKPIQRTIDYIMLSPSLLQKAEPGSFFVLGLPKGLDSNERRPKGYASDHNPIAVDLKAGRSR
jgi:endonuclease/exonuclease/phosphatase family metal-dependent hydrolase